MKWIKKSDKMPKLRQEILTVDMNCGIKNWYRPYVMTFWNLDSQPDFTHWMPLPKEPKEI